MKFRIVGNKADFKLKDKLNIFLLYIFYYNFLEKMGKNISDLAIFAIGPKSFYCNTKL